MLLIAAEIFLTFFAWRRGWKWLALLPVGICLAIGFFAGLVVGSSGGSTEDLGWVTILDVIAIIVLIVMVSVKRTPLETSETKTDTPKE